MQKQIAWNTGNGNITLTYQGEGDGTIAVSSDENGGAAREQTISIQTTNGAVAKNVTVKQSACPIVVGDVKNFAYTGAVQSIELPKGKYKLQCWGAQGGSNAAASSYSITAQAGGKGGYSEGVLTLTQKTILYIFVGGQGSSSGNGGWNGGGGGSGSSSYNSGGTNGVSRMGCGGGATDIALVTSSMTYSSYRNNRSSASLLSRIIVAGGGSGGAMCYKSETKSSTKTVSDYNAAVKYDAYSATYQFYRYRISITLKQGVAYTISSQYFSTIQVTNSSGTVVHQKTDTYSTTYTPPSTVAVTITFMSFEPANGGNCTGGDNTISVTHQEATSSTTTSNNSQAGYAGGGTNGQGYSSSYYGRPNAAGSGGAFGMGANMTRTSNRYCSACGGGGWYGGGSAYSDSSDSYVKYSGGGSGFINTAANASYRPSGYTGLQLDSGTTTAGTSSFESTSGGRETGHSGNGYARITRIE